MDFKLFVLYEFYFGVGLVVIRLLYSEGKFILTVLSLPSIFIFASALFLYTLSVLGYMRDIALALGF